MFNECCGRCCFEQNMSSIVDLQLVITKSISLNPVVLGHLMQAFMN